MQSMSKRKVLLIQNYIAHYNLPIFNLLALNSEIDLTIAHFGKSASNSLFNFKELILSGRKAGPFFFIKENILSICDSYDVVIAMGDIHFLPLMRLGKRKKRKFKLIFWGIGVSASYNNKFDHNKKWDFIRFYFMKGADALLFYSSYPVKKYIQNGFAKEKLFVANNTVEIKKKSNLQKTYESILFIGTLYKEKGIYELLEAYAKAYSKSGDLPDLNIIGDGEEFENINNWIKSQSLSEKISLLGAIYDDYELEKYFLSALASVSPNQAGLSVLKSMGSGVPFITRFDSITGGERFNIINNETGIIYQNSDELTEIICKMKSQKEEYRNMGEKAKIYYNKFRLPEHMVAGFLDAIKFVLTK
jgi:glycosyltransferase involved in cell wall biosynthesis